MAFPMPGVVSRDLYFQRLDELLNALPAECMRLLLDPANAGMTIYEIALAANNGSFDPEKQRRDAEAVRRVRRSWYGDDPDMDYFLLDRSVYTPAVRIDIVRNGYLRALREATDSGRMIRSHYICTGRHFEVVVCRMNSNDNVVNVFVITGEIRPEFLQGPPNFPTETNEDLWVSTTRQRVDQAMNETNFDGNPKREALGLENIATGQADVTYPEPGAPVGLLRPRTTNVVIDTGYSSSANAYK